MFLTSPSKITLSQLPEFEMEGEENRPEMPNFVKKVRGIFRNMNGKQQIYLLVASVLLWHLPWIFFGIDLVDTGFHMAFFQQIFKNPENFDYNFLYYFSGIIGGIVDNLNPGGGILQMRFFGLVTIVLISLLSYNLLKKYFSSSGIFIGVLVVNFSFWNEPRHFFHNHLTSLLFVLSVSLLVRGLKRKQLFPLIAAGFTLALNTFTRIPNLIDFSLFLLIPLWSLLMKENKSKLWQRSLSFLSGAIGGVGVIFLMMLSLGHWKSFLWGLKVMHDMGASNENTHSIHTMLRHYLWEYGAIMLIGTGVFLSIVLTAWLFQFLRARCKFLIFPLGVLFAVILFCVFIKTGIFYPEYFSVLFLLGFAIFSTQRNDKKMTERVVLMVAAIMMLLLIPIGSDSGIFIMGVYASWLGIPIATALFVEIYQKYKTLFGLSPEAFHHPIFFTGFAVLSSCFYVPFRISYYDPGMLLRKTSTVNSKFTKHLYTTEERASAINTLLRELEKHVKPRDYLICLEHTPGLHYLTKTKPFLYDSWLSIHPPDLLQKKIHRAEKETDIHPVMVVQTFWGSGPMINPWKTTAKVRYTMPEKIRKIFDNYIEKHHYEAVWHNDFFIIYKPMTQGNNSRKLQEQPPSFRYKLPDFNSTNSELSLKRL
jgi:hypothetical protein